MFPGGLGILCECALQDLVVRHCRDTWHCRNVAIEHCREAPAEGEDNIDLEI